MPGRPPTDPAYASIQELMDAVDDAIPTPERAVDQPFLMPIEDVFGIKGRGTVVTGRIERGQVQVGETIEILGMGQEVAVAGGHWRGDVPQDSGCRRSGGTTSAACCAAWSGTKCSAGKCWQHQEALRAQGAVPGERVRIEPGRGRATHAVLPGVFGPQFYIRTTDVTGGD